MKFVLVFPDPDTLTCLRRLGPMEHHRVTAVAGTVPASSTEAAADWRRVPLDQVLTLQDVDAVIVGESHAGDAAAGDARDGFIRTCIQAEMPLLISHPIGDLNMAYELQLAQTGGHLAIQPLQSGLWHPCWRHVQQAFHGKQAEQNEASMSLDILREYPSISMPRVQHDFARDALVVRLLLGPIQRIHCYRQEHPTNETLTGVNVQMSDLSGRLVRWSASLGRTERAELRVNGPSPLTVNFQGDPAGWTWAKAADPPVCPSIDPHPDVAILDSFQETVETRASTRQTGPSAWPFRGSPEELWTQACRAMELTEAMKRSARRGRTMDLAGEEPSESGTFKSFMAAGGCLTLLATVTLGLFLIAVDRFQDRTGMFAVTGQWPWFILLVVLVVFLILQTFKLFIPDPRENQP